MKPMSIGARRADGAAPALCVVVALGVAARVYALGRQGLWYDEAQTGWMMRAPFAQMLAGVPRSESAPPLYYAVTWAWVHAFGDTRAGLRSLSAVAGVLTIPAAFAAARTLVGLRAALVAALLVAVNPLLVWYSQEARAYALVVLASTVGLWLFARARERPTAWRVAAWVAISAVAMWTHYFATFLVVPEALVLLVTTRIASRTRAFAVISLGAITLPLLLVAIRQGHHAPWIHRISLVLRIEQVGRFFVDGFNPPAGTAVAVLSGVLAATGFALAVNRGDDRSRIAVVAAIAAGGLGLPLLAVIAGFDYFDGRNVVAAAVPMLIVLAAGFAARRSSLLGLSAVGALAAVSIGLIAALQVDPRAQRPDWPALANALNSLPSPRIMQINGGSRSWAVPLSFEVRHTWWLKPRGADVTEFDVIAKLPGGSCRGRLWWGPACAVPSRAPQATAPMHGLHRVATLHAGGFSITRYRADHPIHVTPRSLSGLASTDRAPRGKRHLLITPTREPVIT